MLQPSRDSEDLTRVTMRLRHPTALLPWLSVLLLGACRQAGGPCEISLDCLENEICVEGRCRLSCEYDHQCFEGEVCRHGFCQAYAQLADAGPGGDGAATADSGGTDSAPPDVRAADAARPDTFQPDRSLVDAASPDGWQPDAQQPDAWQPDLRQPDAWQPDTRQPDAWRPDTTQPDAWQPDTRQPDAWQPDLRQPDAWQPDALQTDAAAAPCNGPAPPPALCDPNDPALRACYTFDADTAGTNAGIHDLSSHGNHGTGTDITFEAGVHGSAARFSGQLGSTIQVPDSASLDIADGLTVEAWVKADTLPAVRAGILDNDGQYSIFIYAPDQFRGGGAAPYLFAGQAVTGTWIHVAWTVGGGMEYFYQDGQQVAEQVRTGTLDIANTGPMAVGANSPSGDNLDGLLDTVRVWAEVRSADEICWAAQR